MRLRTLLLPSLSYLHVCARSFYWPGKSDASVDRHGDEYSIMSLRKVPLNIWVCR